LWFGALLFFAVPALLLLTFASFVFFAASALSGVTGEDKFYEHHHWRRFGLWPGNLYFFEPTIRGYFKVAAAPLWFLRTPSNQTLAQEGSHDGRVRAALAARRKRRLVLAEFAFWLGVPLAAGLYFWAHYDETRSAFLHWQPVQTAMEFHAELFAQRYTSREVQSLHNAIFAHGGLLGPEVFVLAFGGLLVLSVFAFFIGNGMKRFPAALKSLAVELCYLAGFQFIEGARVLDPKIGEARGWKRRSAEEIAAAKAARTRRWPFHAPAPSSAPLE